jgi:hypothetical protein
VLDEIDAIFPLEVLLRPVQRRDPGRSSHPQVPAALADQQLPLIVGMTIAQVDVERIRPGDLCRKLDAVELDGDDLAIGERGIEPDSTIHFVDAVFARQVVAGDGQDVAVSPILRLVHLADHSMTGAQALPVDQDLGAARTEHRNEGAAHPVPLAMAVADKDLH